jgi:hypothetical protein
MVGAEAAVALAGRGGQTANAAPDYANVLRGSRAALR